MLLLIALGMLVSALFLPFNDGAAPRPGSSLFYLHRASLSVVSLCFFLGFWKYGGQTLGMRAWRFEVVRDDGNRLEWTDCFKRLIFALISLLPAGLGFWWALVDRQQLAWHDRWSRTRLRRLV